MKNISILVLESSVMQAIADPQYCFSAVNQFFVSSGKPPVFNIELVGLTNEVKLNNGQFIVKTDKLLSEVKHTDLIVVPALFGHLELAIEANKEFIPWMVERYHGGAEIASLCLGAFLVASTGLLDQKKCSTHWNFTTDFATMFPQVDLQHGEIITEETRIYTSGGATSYWNLLLHLVEKYTDRQTAILTSKYFAIDIDRNSQSVFTLFKGQKTHPDKEVMAVQNFIENNIEKKFTIDDLAERVSLSRRSLERRFKQSTHNSLLEYIQRVKIESAKRCFETSRKNINEVMYELGYNDAKAFRNVFKKITGLTPLEYRNKYNKQLLIAV